MPPAAQRRAGLDYHTRFYGAGRGTRATKSRGVSFEPACSLVFKQRANAGLLGHGEPIAGFQAGVNVHLVASQGSRGIAGNLILLQEENPLLLLLELGR